MNSTVFESDNVKGPVLVVGNFLSSAPGIYNLCEDIVAQLRSAGWRVLTTSSRVSRPHRLYDMLSTVWRQRRVFRAASVDVFSGPSFIWAECVCQMLDALHIPYLISLRGGGLPQFAARWPRRVRRLLSRAPIVTAPSPYLIQHMREFRSDIVMLPNPISLSSYEFRLRAHAEPRLLWMRAFHKIYNPSLAPQVVAALAKEFSEVSLKMIGRDKGDGSLARTKREVERLGLGDKVGFSGGVPKTSVPQCLQDGDIFLNTTDVDNTPVSVIEALACGLCVVSTNVGGIPYLLEDGRNSLVVPPGDAAAMAAAVRRILTEPGLSERLSRSGRATAEAFDWRSVLNQWDELLGSLTEQGK